MTVCPVAMAVAFSSGRPSGAAPPHRATEARSQPWTWSVSDPGGIRPGSDQQSRPSASGCRVGRFEDVGVHVERGHGVGATEPARGRLDRDTSGENLCCREVAEDMEPDTSHPALKVRTGEISRRRRAPIGSDVH